MPYNVHRKPGNENPSYSPPNEYTSLLPTQTIENGSGNNENENDGETFGTRRSNYQPIVSELWLLLKGSIPVILAYTLQMSLQTITVIIVGHSSPMNLAVSAFSLMFALVTGWMIALGGTTALDTLASSAFTGGNKGDLGILLQRAFLVLGTFYVPVAILWACSNPLFQALGQDPELSYLTSKYLTFLIPGGLGYIYFEVMKKYLQAQGIMRAGTYVLIIVAPLHAVLTYSLCYTFGFGLLGAPVAANISYWLSFVLMVLYSNFIAGSECWNGWSREALNRKSLWTFSRLAVLGILHIGTEWWAFEIVALAAGRLGTTALAAQSVIMTADQILNTIPFGLGVTTSSRVGNLLGSRDTKGARRATHLAAFLSVIFGCVVLTILMSTRHHFAKIFNNDPNVIELTSEIMPFVALFQIADGMNGSCGGVLRGMGRQHLGAAVNLVSYYCFALPLGIYLAFPVGLGLQGLWVGQCVALYCAGILEWIIVTCSRWEEEVRRAFRRMDTEILQEDAPRLETATDV